MPTYFEKIFPAFFKMRLKEGKNLVQAAARKKILDFPFLSH